MLIHNENTTIRRELASQVLRLFFNGTLKDEIDALPVRMIPKENYSMRCCIYKDRAMIRYRILALLGISIEKSDDELKLLRDFVEDAYERTTIEAPVLTVLDVACSSCNTGSYTVTDLCRGCIARPCMSNCPVDAVKFINGRSTIDQDACVKCGKCAAVCPFKAVTYNPIPCEESCPVKALKKLPDGKEEIDYSKCIHCGRCTRSCPFGAVMERSQIIDVAQALLSEKEVVAMVAPSIVGQLPGTPAQLYEAIKKIGFNAVHPVAKGAEKTAQHEAMELQEVVSNNGGILGTSCCPAYTEAVEKHVVSFKDNVSSTPSPMSYTAEDAKNENRERITVFIGPCIAKKHEGIEDKNVDFVLTYEELGAFLVAKRIFVAECEESKESKGFFYGQGFAESGGVTEAVQHYYGDKKIDAIQIDGLNKKGLKKLELAGEGKIKGQLVEVMSCEGGCLCGPGIISNPKISKKAQQNYCSKLKEKLKP